MATRVHTRGYTAFPSSVCGLCAFLYMFGIFLLPSWGAVVLGGWEVGEGLLTPVILPSYTFLWLCL